MLWWGRSRTDWWRRNSTARLNPSAHRRKTKGIACVNPKFRPWTPEEDTLLGKLPDRLVAQKLKRSFKAVQSRRFGKGIGSANQPRVWTPREDALLGTMVDALIAKRLKRTAKAVQARRFSLGIASPTFRQRKWTAEEDKLFEKFSNREIARRLKRTVNSVEHRRSRLAFAP